MLLSDQPLRRGLSFQTILFPANAVVTQSVELSNLASVIPESAMFLESSLSTQELILFYEKVYRPVTGEFYKKDSKGNKSVILGENPLRK